MFRKLANEKKNVVKEPSNESLGGKNMQRTSTSSAFVRITI